MKIKIFSAVFFISFLFFSCPGQNKAFIPEPDFGVYVTEKTIQIDNITETKTGVSAAFMPEWLLTFIEGGNKAVERIEKYRDKYVFVGVNESANFITLNKWAENFTPQQDLAVLAARRIDERMIQGASLYPDDEYGAFYLTMVTAAYGTAYQEAEKEDFYWFKKDSSDVYNFFILITIDKNTMQAIIRDMAAKAAAEAAPTGSQLISVNRLRQTFFEGF